MKAKSNPFHRASRLFTMGLGLAAAGINSQSALAVDWTNGGADQIFNNTVNWSADPNGQTVVINIATAGSQPILSVNQTIGPVDIIIGNGGGTGRFDHNAGAAGTGDGNWMFVGGGNSNGTYNLANTAGSGGTLTGFGLGSGSMDVGGFSQNGRLIVGDSGTSNGTLNMDTSGVLNAKRGDLGLIVATNGGHGTINLDKGTINTTQAWFGDNSTGSLGELKMSDGTINTSSFLILGRGDGTGTLAMTGGVINIASELWFAEATSATRTASGTATISGGTMNVGTWAVVGRSGNNTATGTLTVNGGIVNVRTAGGGNGDLEIGTFDAATGAVNISSGFLNLYSNSGIIVGAANSTANNSLTQSGGVVTFYSDAGTTVGGTGTLTLGRNVGYGQGTGANTYNLSGGTLVVPKIDRSSTAGSGTFNFNGGTLKAAGASTTFMQGLTAANVQANGALIDTNGFDVTIAQPLLAGGGGLVKSGGGTLTLPGANTYTGATSVGAGTLNLTGSLANTAVTVASGAKLALNGNTGGTLTISSGGHLALAVAADSGSQVTRTITGALNLTAASDIADLAYTTIPAVGTYVLATATGGISGTFGSVNYNGIPGTLAVVGNNLQLTVTASAYASWASSKSLTGSNNGTTQDPENDGIRNVLEFVLGGDPLVSSTSILPVQSDDGTYFIFTFNRADASLSEISLTFEYGSNLTGWTPVSIPTAATGIPVNITDNGATDQVVVKVLKGANTKLFGRLRAVR
ncbi:MAG: autotransporter-associated beta strand repeat-containing protein [Luteolibacter sp.]